MIFDKDYYDKSLWLMLKVDRENRDRIIDFIKCIPYELHIQIQDSIRIYKEKVKDNDILFSECDYKLSGDFETNRHVLYWYDINIDNGSLTLGYSILYGYIYWDSIIMELVPYDEMYQLRYFDDELIGNLEYDFTTTETSIACNEKEYNIINTPFGNLIISMLEDRQNRKRLGINRVDIEKIPDELFINDLKGKNSVRKLIKGKKNRL